MGKKIGIKLADGTFYPIMEDGVPQKKLMELTTVQDNQTTASIDLYRSESGTMDDAEYVDTLELSELAPHPGGETSISFAIQLDENNMLSAEVVEPETGKTSTSKSSLVNLPKEKRSDSSDYTLTDISDTEFDAPSLPEAPAAAEVLETDEAPSGVADFQLPDFDLDDFSSVDSLPSTPIADHGEVSLDDGLPEEGGAVSEIPATVDDLPDFGDVSLDLGDEENDPAAAPSFDLDILDLDDFASVENVSKADDSGEDAVQGGGDSDTLAPAELESFAFAASQDEDESHFDALLGKDDSVMDSPVEDLPSFADINLDSDSSGDAGLEDTSFDLPDFDGMTLTSDFSEGSSSKEPSLEMPDFGFGDSEGDFAVSPQNDSVYEEALPDFSKFDLPDFDEPVRNDFSFGEESGLFTENDFNDPAFHAAGTTAATASPLDFSGLYDDRENELRQQESRKRRGGVAVAICVVCALVCVGILLFILFLLPAKISDRAAGAEGHLVVAESSVTSTSEQKADGTAAMEDVIVIVETPSVVPAPPPQTARTPDVVRYEVKWGDTLWDIAQSYYNNPWLYKRIAAVNNIKNPDHIVAGTILTIPPQ